MSIRLDQKQIFSYTLVFFIGIFLARFIYSDQKKSYKATLGLALIPLKIDFFHEKSILPSNLNHKSFYPVVLSKEDKRFLCKWKLVLSTYGKKTKNINILFTRKEIPRFISLWPKLKQNKIKLVKKDLVKKTPYCLHDPEAVYS